MPWAKAGLIIKAGTRRGSRYAAIMVTGSHGVRMQDNYVNDTAGPASGTSPRWLRLDRSGDAVTGYASADGTGTRGSVSTAAFGEFHIREAGSAVTGQATRWEPNPPPSPATRETRRVRS